MSDTVEIIQLIKTTLTRRGAGVKNDPIRIITEYWTMDGQKEFEIDPFADELDRVDENGNIRSSFKKIPKLKFDTLK